jgi:hypothetical protein
MLKHTRQLCNKKFCFVTDVPLVEVTAMLEAHAPQEPIHSWKGFFIHIATIAIGLLIAIGLEQTVEYFHHRHLAHAARAQLLEEVQANGQIAKDDAYAVRMHQRHLQDALQVLDRARDHTLRPTDHIITGRAWSPAQVAAWETARQSGAAAYFSSAEQATFELANWDARTFNADHIEATQAIGRAAMSINVDLLDTNAALPPVERGVYFGHQGDSAAEEALTLRSAGAAQISRLTAVQIDELKQAIRSALYDDQTLLNDCRHLIQQAEEIPKHVRAN